MEQWEFLRALQRAFGFELTLRENGASLTNPDTGAQIRIDDDSVRPDDPAKAGWNDYIVSFSTQHRHFEDLSDAEDYLRLLLRDEVLPIEFYRDGVPRFGGDLTRAEFEGLTAALPAELFGLPAAQLARFEYEVHSWSGRLDTGRRRLEAQT